MDDVTKTIARTMTRPTLIRELLAARATLGVCQAVTLAIRRHRGRLGLSQRAYARARGWSKARIARLESEPGRMRLEDVVKALQGTGFRLYLGPDTDRQDGEVAPLAAPVPPSGSLDVDLTAGELTNGDGVPEDVPLEDVPPEAVSPEHWTAAELLARTESGSRFPAHRNVRRAGRAPAWWLNNRSTDARNLPPHWSSAS